MSEATTSKSSFYPTPVPEPEGTEEWKEFLAPILKNPPTSEERRTDPETWARKCQELSNINVPIWFITEKAIENKENIQLFLDIKRKIERELYLHKHNLPIWEDYGDDRVNDYLHECREALSYDVRHHDSLPEFLQDLEKKCEMAAVLSRTCSGTAISELGRKYDEIESQLYDTQKTIAWGQVPHAIEDLGNAWNLADMELQVVGNSEYPNYIILTSSDTEAIGDLFEILKKTGVIRSVIDSKKGSKAQIIIDREELKREYISTLHDDLKHLAEQKRKARGDIVPDYYEELLDAINITISQKDALLAEERPAVTFQHFGKDDIESYFQFVERMEGNEFATDGTQLAERRSQAISALKEAFGDQYTANANFIFQKIISTALTKHAHNAELKKQASGAIVDVVIDGLEAPHHKTDIEETINVGGQTIDAQFTDISHMQGYRKTQEDAYFATAMDDNLHRKSADIPALLKEVFAQQNEIMKENLSGSTAAVAYLSKDGKLTVANVGDSAVTIYLRNKETGVFEAQRLTTDHRHTEQFEKARIRSAGGGELYTGEIVGDMGNGISMITSVLRCFGANPVHHLATPEPDITQIDLTPLFKDYDVFVDVHCDGRHEAGINDNYYATLLEKDSKTTNPAGNKANLLNTAGYSPKKARASGYFQAEATIRGSYDNMTTLFMHVKPDIKSDIAIGVCDGFMGTETCKPLAANLGENLKSKNNSVDMARRNTTIATYTNTNARNDSIAKS